LRADGPDRDVASRTWDEFTVGEEERFFDIVAWMQTHSEMPGTWQPATIVPRSRLWNWGI
jgi:hypothetical protein